MAAECVRMQPAGPKKYAPRLSSMSRCSPRVSKIGSQKTLHVSDILRHRFCFWHPGSSALSQATCITKHTLLHLIWVCIHRGLSMSTCCIHRCLSKSTCRYVCVTSCHAFAAVRFDSIPELLPGASLQLRVESSTCVSFFIHVHVGLCTSCHALESIRSDSIPELLLGAPLPLRVESSSNHKRRATCGLIDTKCNRADDSRCVHTYRSLFLSLAAYTYI